MEVQPPFMEGLWSLPLPTLWLHSCHGRDASLLTSVQVDRKFSGSVAQWFDVGADQDHSENMLGLQCHFDKTMLFVETASQELVPIVQEVFMAEVSSHPFRSDVSQDLAVIAFVPPASGEGMRGTAVSGTECAGQEGWFIIVQGLSTAYAVMDVLSMQGCLRNDLETSFQAIDVNDIIGEGASGSRWPCCCSEKLEFHHGPRIHLPRGERVGGGSRREHRWIPGAILEPGSRTGSLLHGFRFGDLWRSAFQGPTIWSNGRGRCQVSFCWNPQRIEADTRLQYRTP
eukprot:Skav211323  [mRNA]  locus=scaffold3035:69111:77996:- [translate_table: standard]